MSRYPYTEAYDYMRMSVGDDYGKGLISRGACACITHLIAEAIGLPVENIAQAVADKARAKSAEGEK